MSYKIDLHVHSFYSDGTKSPTELVKKYYKEEYYMISLTDHDGIDGVKEAMIAGEALELKVIPGIEFSTDLDGVDLHILGYYIDIENGELLETIEKLKGFRRERNERLIELLSKQGYALDLKTIEKSSKSKYVGKPNIAREMVSRGYISDYRKAFEDGVFFQTPEAKKIKKKKLTTFEAISIINRAGGIAVLAHPGKIKGTGSKESEEYWTNLDTILKTLKKAGLKGLECYYPIHSQEDTLKYVVLAEKYHLHITTGSDYHGDR